MKKQLYIILGAILFCMIVTIVSQDRQIKNLTDERDKYKSNTEVLLADCKQFQVRDSLNAARVGSLELTIKEFEKFRAQDAALIKELTGKNRDLQQLNKAQLNTIEQLRCVPHDTLLLVDSVYITATSVHCGDEWYTFDGLLTEDSFTGTMTSHDEIVLTETVRYKKFLFWKTGKIKDRQLDAVSLNPHSTITGLEHIIIDK